MTICEPVNAAGMCVHCAWDDHLAYLADNPNVEQDRREAQDVAADTRRKHHQEEGR